MRHKLTTTDRQRGGRKTATKPGGKCPRCGRTYTTHLALIGHKGLHAYADKHCGGDMKAAAKSFNMLGVAATDPVPTNGAFAKAHAEARRVRGAA